MDLFYCKNLSSLPETIGDLDNLVELHLNNLASLVDLPTSLAKCKDLKSIEMENSTIKRLPNAITGSKTLEILKIRNSYKSNLISLGNITNCSSLKVLEIHSKDRLNQPSLPENFGLLKKLEKINKNNYY